MGSLNEEKHTLHLRDIVYVGVSKNGCISVTMVLLVSYPVRYSYDIGLLGKWWLFRVIQTIKKQILNVDEKNPAQVSVSVNLGATDNRKS